MKKSQILAVIMATSIFMSFALGSGSTSSDSTKAISGTSGDNNVTDDKDAADATTTAPKTLMPTIDEQVVVDEDGIKITAKEYTSDSIFGDGIKFLIENETEYNLTIGINALIVNDFMISDTFVTEVAAGKKTNETMTLSSSQLKAAGIDVIGQIEVYFHIYDSDTWDDILNPDCVTIKTSLYDQMDTTADDSGEVLFDEGGVRIIGKAVNDSDFWGAAVLFYVENNSGRDVTVRADNVSINGFTFDSAYFSTTVYDGKKVYDDMTLFSSELEANDIKNIEEVSLTFEIYDPDSYSTITESDEITFYTK